MRIAVFGATGRTGQHVVRLARDRGHEVIAAARGATRSDWPSDVRAVAVDIRDAAAVTTALTGADAAVVAVGVGSSRGPTTVYSDGVANVLHGLAATGARRLTVISAVPAGPRDALSAGQRLVSRILDRFFAATYTDMRSMEATLRTSTLGWTCLRAPRLIDRPARGRYRLDERPVGGSITHTDLAAALLDTLETSTYERQFRYVSG